MNDINLIQEKILSNPDRLCAMVYAQSNQIPGYVWLTKCLSDAGHLGIFCHHKHTKLSELERNILKNCETALVAMEDLSQFKGIDVFFSDEITAVHAPDGAVTVGIFHSLPEGAPESINVALHFSRNIFLVKTLDYFAVARVDNVHFTQEEFAPLVKNIYPGELMAGRRSQFDIIPAGYPKIDYMQKSLHSDELNTIFYAPTNVNLPFAEVEEWGKKIISLLLEGFPEYQIVFRPYPTKKNIDIAENISSHFSDNSNFILDKTRSGIDYLRTSAFVISDTSSIGLSFALSTGRPYISSTLSKPGLAMNNPVENLLGYHARTLKQLLNGAQSVLDKKEYWHDKIMLERRKYVYNPGDSCQYLAESLPYIANRGSREDWLSIERKPWEGLNDPVNAIKHVKSLLKREYITTARQVADLVISRYPDRKGEIDALFSFFQ